MALSLTVTPIEFFKGNCKVRFATGFFYVEGEEVEKGKFTIERVFLVTCKHCVRDEEENYCPDKLSLIVHTDINDLTKNKRMNIDLHDPNGNPNGLNTQIKRWISL